MSLIWINGMDYGWHLELFPFFQCSYVYRCSHTFTSWAYKYLSFLWKLFFYNFPLGNFAPQLLMFCATGIESFWRQKQTFWLDGKTLQWFCIWNALLCDLTDSPLLICSPRLSFEIQTQSSRWFILISLSCKVKELRYSKKIPCLPTCW